MAKTGASTISIFMEYVPGGSVASLLDEFGAFSDEMAARYIVEVLDGVVFLHDNNVIHRCAFHNSGQAYVRSAGKMQKHPILDCKGHDCVMVSMRGCQGVHTNGANR